MIRKTKFWVILFSAVFVIGIAAFFLLRSAGAGQGATARIWLNGEIVQEIDLGSVVVPYEFDITTDLGTNRVRVEHGSIAVVSADCPDQVCVKHGCLSSKATPIVCLPNKIVIQYSGSVSETVDAVAGGVS